MFNCYTTFAAVFTQDNLCDVDLDDSFSQQPTLLDKLMLTIEILQFIIDQDCYPNVSIAYRILLTVLVIVASAERSFPKLKILKNCLRSTILQID